MSSSDLTPATPPFSSSLSALQDLIAVVAQLRSPEGGCPWDLAQTPETLIPYILEEAYEAVDAIKQGNSDAIADELGDLLLQVVLQAQIASEVGDFDLATVANKITQKLIRRHPHVFGSVQADTPDEVHANWEQIKTQEEQPNADSPQLSPRLKRYARSLPSLTAAMKISKKAAGVGFEWDNLEGVWDKFREELGELQEALETNDKAHQESELGDLLFTIVNLARWCDLDPDAALQGTNDRFIQRFSLVESLADRPLGEYTLAEFEELWQQVKAKIREQQTQS